MDASDVRTITIDDEIYLRTFVESDTTAVLKTVRDNYEHLRTFMEWAKPDYSLSDAEEFINKSVSERAENRTLNFGMFRGDKLIGTIGFAKFDHYAKVAEIGYWISQDEEGKGIMSRACRSLLDLAFGELGMNRVQIRCASANTRSAAIPEKLGFLKEGVQRRHIVRNGITYDFAIYGLLSSEWLSEGGAY
jgi:ribosomal-protein-serine acetyltransferase